MTPAQNAIEKKTSQLVHELGQPWRFSDLNKLAELLKECKHDSIWGLAIQQIMAQEPDAARLESLLDGLANQAIDDFVTMTEIVGITATLLLLRYFDTKNPK